MKKLDLNKKKSRREEIIWLRSRFVTCQYLEGFRWLTSHPKPRVGKLKRDKFAKRNVLQRKQIDYKSIQILYNLIGRLGRRDIR